VRDDEESLIRRHSVSSQRTTSSQRMRRPWSLVILRANGSMPSLRTGHSSINSAYSGHAQSTLRLFCLLMSKIFPRECGLRQPWRTTSFKASAQRNGSAAAGVDISSRSVLHIFFSVCKELMMNSLMDVPGLSTCELRFVKPTVSPLILHAFSDSNPSMGPRESAGPGRCSPSGHNAQLSEKFY
jgi:hypothetical protein